FVRRSSRRIHPMRIDVLTTFPELFTTDAPGVLGVSIPRRAVDAGALEVVATNIRDHTLNKHDKTDDRPFGGGPGMVMTCQPLWDAVMAAEGLDTRPANRVVLSPQGVPLTQQLVEQLAAEPRLLLICGHYEGIDERVIERLDPLEVSLGDYVLSGGELGALVLIDAVARLLPGVLGHDDSAGQDSFAGVRTTNADGGPIDPKELAKWKAEFRVPDEAQLLDCPHYTRPRNWEGMEIPEVLLGGDHNAVARWRLEQMVRRTRERRPDLLGE
ncbi:MAG: tRNA (guanine(37)-N(1))-methyltransferase, partial [Phycisphaerales bacterium]|nr:tRNA (guanine(37)-N(1))-methyltransferase [Phycisphaerales bacterium]